MLLNIFNCSPRGRKSNSALLSGAFARGFCAGGEHGFEEFFMAEPGDFKRGVEAFPQKSVALMAFPIYVDAMPGLAKAFIEELGAYRGGCASTSMIFLIQTGFPEESHTRPMAAYLPKLAKRLGAPCPGVIRMGAGEGVRHQTKKPRGAKILGRFENLGRIYAESGVLDPQILAKLAGPARIPPLLAHLILPLVNHFYWNRELKKNGAYAKRFDRPLE